MSVLPGLDMSTGSLGQGLSPGLGMALAARLKNQDFHTWVMIGDGDSVVRLSSELMKRQDLGYCVISTIDLAGPRCILRACPRHLRSWCAPRRSRGDRLTSLCDRDKAKVRRSDGRGLS